MKCKILIAQEGRSDKPLSGPIIKRLHQEGTFEVIIGNVHKHSFGDSYFKIKTLTEHYQPDAFLAVGDRIEMTAATAAVFHTTPRPLIFHYGAGVTNYPISTFDDINRHCISMWADILLTESKEASLFCMEHFDFIPKGKIINVGHTHLDDLEIDESMVPPNETYNLVLYNPTTMYLEQLPFNWKKDDPANRIIVIGPNSDPWLLSNTLIPDYENLPRSQFLGLLKNCLKFYTNSSCAYYEAPLFLKPEQIVILGDRNKNRNTIFTGERGASDKIVKIIKEWWLECLKERK